MINKPQVNKILDCETLGYNELAKKHTMNIMIL